MAKYTLFHHIASFRILILILKKIVAICLAPLRTPVRAIFLILSLWLGMGTALYGISYAAYKSREQIVVAKRAQLQKEATHWQRILQSHPTAREALLGAYATSVALGDNERATQYKALLQRIDPNNDQVKSL